MMFGNTKIRFVFFSGLVIFAFSASTDEDNTALQCSENEDFNANASPCVIHCVNRHFTHCPYPNKPACVCKNGYIRRTSDGPCIPYSDCRFLNP